MGLGFGSGEGFDLHEVSGLLFFFIDLNKKRSALLGVVLNFASRLGRQPKLVRTNAMFVTLMQTRMFR